MLPRLEAEAELSAINASSVAFGGMKPHARQRYLSQLRRRAAGQVEAAKASPARLSMMGIGVQIVPRGGVDG